MGIEDNKEKISILLEDLSSLESYAKDLFSFLPLPVCLVSSVGIILEANFALEEISGYKVDEIIGQPIEIIIPREKLLMLSDETFKKGFVKTKETIILSKDKKKIPVSVSTKLRKSEEGEVTGYFLGVFDLSDIKKTESELRQKIEELETFHRITVGRELKMIQLKEEIERLKREKEK